MIVIRSVLLTLAAVFGLVYLWMGCDADKVFSIVRYMYVLRFVENNFVEPVDFTKLEQGAYKGILDAVGDKHTIYMPPEEFQALEAQTRGDFGGIGIVMDFSDDGRVYVGSVFEEAPAAAAGLVVGDEIVAVDGTATLDLAPEEIASRIRGKEGTSVSLTIRREGAEFAAEIIRDTISYPTVAAKELTDTPSIAYVRISHFGDKTADEFRKEWDKAKRDAKQAMIIDLRFNPGGLLSSVTEIAGLLVPQGEIVSIVDNTGYREVIESDLVEANPLPLVVLVNEYSASASEILAGALKDHERARIIGTTTYGKGSVQSVRPLFNEDGIKVTVARYYLPNGESIDGVGVEPDEVVDFDRELGYDNQLAAATSYLTATYNLGE